MKPFEIPKALDSIVDAHITVETIVSVIKAGDSDTRYALAGLWLSEGIPYYFKSQPAAYEGMRMWLSRKLHIHAKEITIIGSGRQGFSLSPDKNLGRPFRKDSDLDLSVVSSSLFRKTKKVFNK